MSIFPNSLLLISRFRHRTRGITCAFKSTWFAHLSRLPLGRISLQQSRYFGFLSGRSRTLNLEDDRFAGGRPGPSDVFLNLLEMMKPGALAIFEEKAYGSHRRDERVED